jgi:hypothetical protein
MLMVEAFELRLMNEPPKDPFAVGSMSMVSLFQIFCMVMSFVVE